jgi:hypothetical protein
VGRYSGSLSIQRAKRGANKVQKVESWAAIFRRLSR